MCVTITERHMERMLEEGQRSRYTYQTFSITQPYPRSKAKYKNILEESDEWPSASLAAWNLNNNVKGEINLLKSCLKFRDRE